MAERAADIAEALKWPQQDRSRVVQSALFADLDETETQLVKILREKGEVGIDVLGYQVSLPPSQMASVLLNLEFKGVIRSLPGKRYQAI
jgi:DNA processing protein